MRCRDLKGNPQCIPYRDIQYIACSRWKHHGIQVKSRSTRLLTERRHRLRGDICTSCVVHFHQIHTYEMGHTPADIKTTFLNGVVKEEVYVEQPLGVETLDRKTHVCKLKKALYELRRNPWDRTYSYIRSLNITQSDGDLNLCYKVEMKS